MSESVGNGFARPAGGRLRRARTRVAGSLCIALGALAVACPGAAAQLPDLTGPVNDLTGPVKLPIQDGAVGDALPDGPVNDIVDGVVWVPANTVGNGVLAGLASPGTTVTVKGADQ